MASIEAIASIDAIARISHHSEVCACTMYDKIIITHTCTCSTKPYHKTSLLCCLWHCYLSCTLVTIQKQQTRDIVRHTLYYGDNYICTRVAVEMEIRIIVYMSDIVAILSQE